MNYLISDDLGNIYLDRDKIIGLRSKLIRKYAKVVSHYCAKHELHPNELHHLRNNMPFTGYETLSDLSLSRDYVCTYNEQEYPEIVYLINDLLRGDRKAIDKIHTLALIDDEMGKYYKMLELCIKADCSSKGKSKIKRFMERLVGKKD